MIYLLFTQNLFYGEGNPMEVTETASVSIINSKNEVKNVASSSKKAAVDKTAVKNENAESKQLVDSFSKEKEVTSDETGIYSKESISKALKSAEEQRTQAFVSMIQKMIESQGHSSKLSVSNITKNIKLNFAVDDIDSAKRSISDGGDYSVDAVATRIMDMAKALGGNDPLKISVLRDAVTKGFGKAAETLGLKDDDMPDITKSTYTEIMKRFDDWENSFKTDDTDDKSEK